MNKLNFIGNLPLKGILYIYFLSGFWGTIYPYSNSCEARVFSNFSNSANGVSETDQSYSLNLHYDPKSVSHFNEEQFNVAVVNCSSVDTLPTKIYRHKGDDLVPPEVKNYSPRIIPPVEHPRLWVTPDFLPKLRTRILASENSHAWSQVSKMALDDYTFRLDTSKNIIYSGTTDQSGPLELAIKAKAFYYLVTQDEKVGKEAVHLLYEYYEVLFFGENYAGDISRPMGRAIYIGSLVYDWCYNLLDENLKSFFRKRMLQVAKKMEIGWPPFKESIVNGHGNEAQINRDLLAMSIAVYNEDTIPYQYTSYAILENLVPMRQFEYQSPRHNQGVDYGAYRLGWELHAAWLFYRMSGVRIFDCNFEDLSYYWQYMRLPGGQMLRDGDRFNVHDSDSTYYWKQPITALLSYTYNQDAHLKAEFIAQGGLPDNPVLYLLLNDPGISPKHNYETIPLTKEFGPVLGAMIARTGWDQSYHSNDVIAEIKGGGYHFGNHQHADAGALQIYYKGFQVGDLGLYLSYGTVYDFNFNKRSIAHSMMLAVDTLEEITGASHIMREEYYDGGTRFNQRFPKTPAEVQNDPWYDNGSVLSASYGPSKMRPEYSYFKVGLAGAYTSKVSDYQREFCFLNFDDPKVPAAIILLDNMTTSNKNFKKYWQINTLNSPETSESGWLLYDNKGVDTGWTQVHMLIPTIENRETNILSGAEANSSFEIQFNLNSNLREANGHRIMVRPVENNFNDRFLTVFLMTSNQEHSISVEYLETSVSYVTLIDDHVVSMSSSGHLINNEFHINLPRQNLYKVLLTGLEPGFWNVQGTDSEFNFNFNIKPNENSIYFQTEGKNLTVSPGRAYGVKTYDTGQY